MYLIKLFFLKLKLIEFSHSICSRHVGSKWSTLYFLRAALTAGSVACWTATAEIIPLDRVGFSLSDLEI